ncbi:MAG: PaaI family thioesterase [Methyloligellaceae bacterium]
MSRVSIEQMNKILHNGLPNSAKVGMIVETIGDGTCTMRLPVDETMVRPGGTLSGPSMMGLADAAMWVCVMSKIGDVQLAVTTNFNINFLRKPKMQDIIAEGKSIKTGKQLAVIEVTLFTAGEEHEPVAHATGTYSIPPR